MPNTVKITITPAQVELSKKCAGMIEATGLQRRSRNYTGLHIPDRFIFGYLGEAAVVNWLRMEGVWFRHMLAPTGKRQDNEFYVKVDDRRRHLDAKTASSPTYRFMMFPEAQRDPAFYYVGVRLNGETEAEIMGWLDHTDIPDMEVRDFGRGVPTRCRPFNLLREPADLVRALDKGVAE